MKFFGRQDHLVEIVCGIIITAPVITTMIMAMKRSDLRLGILTIAASFIICLILIAFDSEKRSK